MLFKKNRHAQASRSGAPSAFRTTMRTEGATQFRGKPLSPRSSSDRLFFAEEQLEPYDRRPKEYVNSDKMHFIEDLQRGSSSNARPLSSTSSTTRSAAAIAASRAYTAHTPSSLGSGSRASQPPFSLGSGSRTSYTRSSATTSSSSPPSSLGSGSRTSYTRSSAKASSASMPGSWVDSEDEERSVRGSTTSSFSGAQSSRGYLRSESWPASMYSSGIKAGTIVPDDSISCAGSRPTPRGSRVELPRSSNPRSSTGERTRFEIGFYVKTRPRRR